MEKLRSQESVVSDQEKLSGQLSVVSGQALYNEDYFKILSAFDHENINGPNTGNSFGSTSSTAGFGRTQSAPMIDTYYIYSFDGKLMAEYDHDGNCVKDYIYAGNRLIAEYQPQTGKYYYYMNDQINSTRIITDDYGAVVYSAAHRPFGKFKDVWTKTYDPKLKFSGKEREDYSDLDYFGARYYDHNSYRFISVDPIINRTEALVNPQLWNLYSYCRNNPTTYFDPDGRDYDNMWLFGAERARIYRKYGDKAGTEYDEFMTKSWAEAVVIVAALIIPFIESEHCYSRPKKKKNVDDFIGSRTGDKTKGRSRIYEMEGGLEQANKDFDALNPGNVRDYSGGKRVGELKDGRTVILRPGSKDGRPTLEIQKGKNKIKFRYDD